LRRRRDRPEIAAGARERRIAAAPQGRELDSRGRQLLLAADQHEPGLVAQHADAEGRLASDAPPARDCAATAATASAPRSRSRIGQAQLFLRREHRHEGAGGGGGERRLTQLHVAGRDGRAGARRPRPGAALTAELDEL
jgi:hypothetical protein